VVRDWFNGAMAESRPNPQATVVMLERYQGGDRAALHQWFARYYDRMLAVAAFERQIGPVTMPTFVP
jgi:hypothetical protein